MTATITVNPDATHFVVSAPGSVQAGNSFSVTVTALDAFGDTDTNFSGALAFSSSDPHPATLPGSVFLSSGTGTFSVTLFTGPSQTVTVTSSNVRGTVTGSTTVAVTAASTSKFHVTAAPGSITAGNTTTLTVQATDAFGNNTTGFSGALTFTGSDPLAVYPSGATITNSSGTGYVVTLKTAGSQTVTVTSGAVSGTSNGVTVSGNTATHFRVTGPVSSPSGSLFSVTVQALDQFGNDTSLYSGTVHFTTSDPSGSNVLPADSTLVGGVGTFSVTLNTPGPQTVTATDTITSSIMGTGTVNISPVCTAASKTFSNSGPITIADVSPASPYPSQIAVSMPGQRVGTVTVTLHGFNHSFPSDVDMLLVAPGGQMLVLMSDAYAGEITKIPVDVVFDDRASMAIPQLNSNVPLPGGTYKPTAYSGRAPTLNSPAPPAPYPIPAPEGTSSFVSSFDGIDPNGTWSLYIQDNVGGDFGAVNGGWSITITPAQTTTSNNTAIAIPVSATPIVYPSVIAVSGLPGNIVKMAVTLNNFISACQADPAFLLVGPSPALKNIVLVSEAGGCFGPSTTVSFTLDDAAGPQLPAFVSGGSFASGTYQPTSHIHNTSGRTIGFPGATFTAPIAEPAPDGTATLGSVFNGSDPNGNWSLYALDEFNVQPSQLGDGVSPTWSLTIQTDCPADTICDISPSANPSTYGNPVTFTATVTAPGGGTVFGNVDFLDNGTLLPSGGNKALNGSGVAAYTTPSGTTLTGGSHNIQASYKGNTTYAVSASSAPVQIVDPAATVTTVMTSGTPSNAGSGVTFTATVTSGAAGTLTGTVQFKNGAVNLGTAVTLVAGVATSPSITTLPAGTLTIKAVYSGDSNFATSTGTVTQVVIPGPATHFTITGAPANATAGTSFGFNVQARDQFGNVATAYAGTVHFTSSDPHPATLPADQTLTSGAKAFNATLFITPSQTITVTDTVDTSLTPATINMPVVPGATSKFVVTAPATSAAGSAFTVTVTAEDAFNNVTPGYSGFVHFTSSDPHPATLPTNTTLTSGTKTFTNGVVLFTAPSDSVTVNDTVTTTITGTKTVTVTPLAATHLNVTAPPTVTAGTAFTATVTAQDTYNNTATSYAGTVHFTSSDAGAILPPNSTLPGGSKSFSVTVVKTPIQSLTATDIVTATITGTASLSVNAGVATQYVFKSLISPETAGSSFSFRLTALDAEGNTATGYSGTVHFSSSDPHPATLPANSPLTAGTAIFNATLFTAPSQTITATDSGNASLTATSPSITVNAAATTSKFGITAPASVNAGVAFNITVKAQDAFGNTTPLYGGTVHFTSTDPLATAPADTTLTSGVGTFSSTLQTVGSQTITGTDTATSSITGTSNVISVSKSATTVTLAASINPMYFRHRGIITATVHVTGGSGKTTGMVAFKNGATVLATIAVAANGTATFNATNLHFGRYSITGTYSGDSNYNPSTSTSLTLTVSPAGRFVP